MPFKKTDAKNSQASTSVRKIFVGRTYELFFFTQHILKPEDPSYNIFFISGNGGVGKTTLLARFIDEIHTASFKDYCLAALVDERQTSLANIMEKLAIQLGLEGEFEKALIRYKETLRKIQNEQESQQEAIGKTITAAVVESLVKDVPFAGGLLEKATKPIVEYAWNELHEHRLFKETKQLEDPILDLTKSFVKELNHLADTPVTLTFNQLKRRRRVILCFDTFEQLAIEAASWLLDYFLETDISMNVVLVITGRDPIERSTPDDPKRWLPYYEKHVLYSLSLNSFSQEETRLYLAEHGIMEQSRIETIWQLSHGLPLYLSLLTFNPLGEVDPTTSVVTNFMRWIPGQEQIKRRLVLDAALLSKPFNMDDLLAFTYLPEQELPNLYSWLIGQPFIRNSPQDGRYRYHELAQEMFSRHLYQRSPKEYFVALKAIVAYYKQQVEKIQAEKGQEVQTSAEWSELVHALIRQLFLLPDEASNVRVIELALQSYEYTKQPGEIVRTLHEYSHKQATANLLLQYIEADLTGQEHKVLVTSHEILEKVIHKYKDTFSSELLADIYCKRGIARVSLKQYNQALEEFNQTLKFNPVLAWAYCLRGLTYRSLKEYTQAILDFDHALTLDPKLGLVYNDWGLTYFSLKERQQTIESLNLKAKTDPDYPWVYFHRGVAYREINEYQRALEDLDYVLELNPNYAIAYSERGITYRMLQNYDQAISDFNYALALNPEDAWTYADRGETYRLRKEFQNALEDFDRALTLDAKYVWAYARRGQTYSSLHIYDAAFEDFDRALALDPTYDWVHAYRGQAHYHLKEYEEAIYEFNYAIKLNFKESWIYAERGWAYLWLKSINQAKDDFVQSWQLDPANLYNGWMIEWICMCLDKADPGTLEHLKLLAAINSNHYVSFICRGVALWLDRDYEAAQAELVKAIPLAKETWCTTFWYGIISVSLNQDQEAIAKIKQALKEGLPPILITPLSWFQWEKPDFYEKDVVPLLEQFYPEAVV